MNDDVYPKISVMLSVLTSLSPHTMTMTENKCG